MAAGRARMLELSETRHSPRTTAAYERHWKDFVGWCQASGRKALPADPDTVALYVSCEVPAYAIATLELRLAAIRHRHVTAGWQSPTNTQVVRAVMAGAKRKNVRPLNRKAAMTVPELRAICDLLLETGTKRAIRDRAIFLLGFAGSFRRSELAQLDLSDIDLRDDRVSVFLRRSKTDQEGQGRQLVIPRAGNPHVCPVLSLLAWLAKRGHEPGPLFTETSGVQIYQALKAAAAAAGFDAKRFGAHSLRAGAITAAVDAGADIHDIMSLSGHRSIETVARYVRRSVARYPLAKVL